MQVNVYIIDRFVLRLGLQKSSWRKDEWIHDRPKLENCIKAHIMNVLNGLQDRVIQPN